MIFHEVHLDKNIDKHNYIEIKPISDTHLGDLQCNEELLMQDIEWIKEKPNRYTLLNGDILNCATIHSVSDSYSSKMNPHDELKYARKLFMPIKDKILTSVRGNHEYRIYKSDGIDISEELSFSLGCAYNAEGILLKVRFGERKTNQKPQVYTIYHTHGSSSAQLPGGKLNKLYRLRNIVIADCYIVSHTHEKIAFKKNIFIPDIRNNKIVKKEQVFINTGAYLKWGGYAESKNYHPSNLGTLKLRFYSSEKRIEIIQ
ncbi:metallophosphoesterase [Halocella sp. SP3-1]|uniref:metallophosphoesterase n=1 Tax=Halocella sp. SP3-1 TaxID=2382161 RepID=UPI000F754AB0|nr:metallophosphoesterase [Halocella sp. SP3-1]AZO96150.1 hypothetical protein D7D81_16990 [Halocella sp. SP3-1]